MNSLDGKTFIYIDKSRKKITVTVRVGCYDNGRPAIQLMTKGPAPLAVITVNFPEEEMTSNEAAMKIGQENKILAKAWYDTGWFEDTGRRVRSGFCAYPIWKVKET